jgi:hypothetical protein
MNPDVELARHCVRLLNEMIASDPAATTALLKHRETCNATLADHPTIIVAVAADEKRGYSVGLLGVLNGLCGYYGEEGSGHGPVAVQFESERALRAVVLDEEPEVDLRRIERRG